MTTHEHLTIGGDWVPYPLPRPRHLTERQRDLLVVLKASKAPTRTRDVCRLYVNASAALRRLEAMGLVRRVARGRWEAT